MGDCVGELGVFSLSLWIPSVPCVATFDKVPLVHKRERVRENLHRHKVDTQVENAHPTLRLGEGVEGGGGVGGRVGGREGG